MIRRLHVSFRNEFGGAPDDAPETDLTGRLFALFHVCSQHDPIDEHLGVLRGRPLDRTVTRPLPVAGKGRAARSLLTPKWVRKRAGPSVPPYCGAHG